jgi:hypothetical protein
MPNKKPFKQLPEKIARRHYYYCHEEDGKRLFIGEKGLAKMESIANPLLQRIRNKNFNLTADEHLTFAGYIALSYCRVPTFERRLNNLYTFMQAKNLEWIIGNEEIHRRLIERSKAEGDPIDLEKLRDDIKNGSTVLTQENRGWSIKRMFETADMLQDVIDLMHWSFLHADERDDGFLTTDNPVSVFDPLSPRGPAFQSSREAHFLFPVSRTLCLLGTHYKLLDRKCSAYEVRQINRQNIECADTQVYAPFKSEGVQKILNNQCADRKYSRVLLRKGKAVIEPES